MSRADRTEAGKAVERIAWMAVRETDKGTAVLVGFETDVCVAQSAIGLHDQGLRAVVLEDAMWSNSAQQHERGLARMTAAGVERNDCKGLVFEWLRRDDVATEIFRAAEQYGDPPWLL